MFTNNDELRRLVQFHLPTRIEIQRRLGHFCETSAYVAASISLLRPTASRCAFP
ncbi:hypothetical protein AWB64_00860 [Caballeronia sordidicola]|uniref:Uncharacterized protein n=1 Tax=Caballeronia sordidicola TaxID=196367 RepID=A0A158F6X9_CABSO|nr:hypothetical protein AWB64_00860 [Caballeronia sordidicola]